MNNTNIFCGVLITVISTVISGCVTPSLPGSEKVAVTNGPIAQNCQFKGSVSANNEASNMTTSRHSLLIADDYAILKNRAIQLGANTILLSSSSGMTEVKHWRAKTEHNNQAAHVYTGSAYWCPLAKN